jgi:hypothetical protein
MAKKKFNALVYQKGASALPRICKADPTVLADIYPDLKDIRAYRKKIRELEEAVKARSRKICDLIEENKLPRTFICNGVKVMHFEPTHENKIVADHESIANCLNNLDSEDIKLLFEQHYKFKKDALYNLSQCSPKAQKIVQKIASKVHRDSYITMTGCFVGDDSE